jgi:hypothetical protein
LCKTKQKNAHFWWTRKAIKLSNLL